MPRPDKFYFLQNQRVQRIYACVGSSDYPNLTPADVSVLLAMNFYWQPDDGDDAIITTSAATIGAMTLLSRSAVYECQQRLAACGLLIVVRKRRKATTHYRLGPALLTKPTHELKTYLTEKSTALRRSARKATDRRRQCPDGGLGVQMADSTVRCQCPDGGPNVAVDTQMSPDGGLSVQMADPTAHYADSTVRHNVTKLIETKKETTLETDLRSISETRSPEPVDQRSQTRALRSQTRSAGQCGMDRVKGSPHSLRNQPSYDLDLPALPDTPPIALDPSDTPPTDDEIRSFFASLNV